MLRLLLAVVVNLTSAVAAPPWVRHTIDDGSRGADGVRLGDADRDGRTDIVTGWEEAGAVRICFGPEPADVQNRWPVAQIGDVRSPEDAVFADVNQDGWLDVVSCCEGRTQTIFLHLSPGRDSASVRNGRLWKTMPLPASVGMTRWMFCQPLSDGRLVFGSKNPNGQISIARIDETGRGTIDVLRRSGWIMSLAAVDLDEDGDTDVVYSDRKGPTRGIGWLEYDQGKWHDHLMGADDLEVMFLKVVRSGNGPGVYCDTRAGAVVRLQPETDLTNRWQIKQIPHPPVVGGGKSVAVGDIDGDGTDDLVCACEHAEQRVGVYWLPGRAMDSRIPDWHDISGTEQGVKFDRLELLDLDQDGDLDVLTCEERDQLGVIWYENPQNVSVSQGGNSLH